MNRDEVFERALLRYKRYYNIILDDVTAPFKAEAIFKSHNEQYYLIKAAKVADIDSNEYVFLDSCEVLTLDRLNEIEKIAWETGLSRIVPSSSHRNSDTTLIIIADRINQDAFEQVKKLRHYKSFYWGFQGWSNFRVVAIEVSLKRIAYNRQGRSLKKLFGNILI